MLYGPLDARKAVLHQKAGRPGKRRMYRADMKTELPPAEGAGKEPNGPESANRR